MQVGFAIVNDTSPEHEGSAHFPSFTTLLFKINIAIVIFVLGWMTARQVSGEIG
jgi:hypothetical protein